MTNNLVTPQLGKQVLKGIRAVPTSSTAATSADTQIYHITLANNNASARTVLITDAAGNPLIPTTSIPANGGLVYTPSTGDCDYLVGGMTWVASGSDVTASLTAFSI